MHAFAFWRATQNCPVSREDRESEGSMRTTLLCHGRDRAPLLVKLQVGEAHQPSHLPVSIPCALTAASHSSRTVALLAKARHIPTAWTPFLPRSRSGGWELRKPAHIWDEDLHVSPTGAACQPPPGPWKMLQATRAKTMPLTASQTQFTSLCYKRTDFFPLSTETSRMS